MSIGSLGIGLNIPFPVFTMQSPSQFAFSIILLKALSTFGSAGRCIAFLCPSDILIK
nr:MAG TPA: hypothetical protein [Bacteriophage sp.]DAH34783.1 MAG TPA: hypothetical protein [Bacteriophage sp.]DAV16009.1 MAG TPA: hypothetical protein [Caudoviricetes sp.]DAY77797.1 MAG TPA: hypothetical protein [Caudoviricetes sp.]